MRKVEKRLIVLEQAVVVTPDESPTMREILEAIWHHKLSREFMNLIRRCVAADCGSGDFTEAQRQRFNEIYRIIITDEFGLEAAERLCGPLAHTAV